ncbi:MAG: hypothetical protein GEU80_16525 [Dehalococcoidia bacterium]|nr:hypothetical protein [Dehalococcoidia bacterium]
MLGLFAAFAITMALTTLTTPTIEASTGAVAATAPVGAQGLAPLQTLAGLESPTYGTDPLLPLALSLSKGWPGYLDVSNTWFDRLTTNGSEAPLALATAPVGAQGLAPLQTLASLGGPAPGTDLLFRLTLSRSKGERAENAFLATDGLAIYYGIIQPALGEPLPVKVRALGEGGANCGTSDVSPASNGRSGAYAVTVYGAAAKDGCPEPGGIIRFVLLYDHLDPGVPAAQTATWEAGGHPLNLSLAGQESPQGRFLGDIPAGPGYALLSWSGPATDIEAALGALPRAVEAAYHIEAFAIRRYVPGAPAFVSDYLRVEPGHIVIVRFP